MTRNVPIAVCVLVSTVTLGVAVNAGAKAGSLVRTGEPTITTTGQQNFGNGTWMTTASGADFDKPDPGGWAGHYTWVVPQTIPPEGADARLIVTAEGRGARHNASATMVLSGITASGGPAGNNVQALAEVGQTNSNSATFRLTPTGSAGSIEIQVQDGPKINFSYGPPFLDPCARAKRACTGETVAIPSPGESATVKGPLAAGASTAAVGVSSSAGNLEGTTIVGEGSQKFSDKIGAAVATCWLVGPKALDVPPRSSLSGALDKTQDNFVKPLKELEKDPEIWLQVCKFLVAELYDLDRSGRLPAAASGCAQQIVISATEKRGKVQFKPGKSKDLPKTAVKYGCAETAGGGAEITAKSSNKKGLRAELGKTLDLGVVRAPDAAPSDATLTFGFES